MNSDLETALTRVWAEYCDSLKAAGKHLLNCKVSQPALDQSKGLRMLARLVKYGLEAGLEFADADFPGFYHPSHETLKIMSDNPDTLHFMATIRDDAEYEISGVRGTVARIIFTTLAREPNGAGLRLQTSLASDQLTVSSDGTFTLTISRNRRGKNWLELQPQGQSLLVRAIFLDRRLEVPPTLKIRRLDAAAAPPLLTPNWIETRLQAAAMVTAGMARAMIGYGDQVRARGWINSFGVDPGLWGAGDPGARYHHGSWSVTHDEALVIEVFPPDCFFWNLQINNHWAESLDYLHHRIHVNKASAIIDADGVVRMVIAHRDPGTGNWLDPAGHTSGMMLARWIDANCTPEIRCTLKPFSSL